MQRKKLFLIFAMIIGLSYFSIGAQIDKDVSNRIAQYKADKSIDFANWPKQGKIIQQSLNITNTIISFATNAHFFTDHELSEINGMKYERYIYRVWREINNQKEELSIWITVMESVANAHEYLLLRWANVSIPFIKHTKGANVGLNVGDTCYVIPYPKGGIQMVWFIRANVVVEVRASELFVTQTSNLARVLDDTINAIAEGKGGASQSSTNVFAK